MIIEIILGVVLIPLFFFNIVAPLFIKKMQKLPARVKFEAHDEDDFLQSRNEKFHVLNATIRSLGFEYIGSSFMGDENAKTHFSLYSNDKDLTCALVVTIANTIKEITYLEYSQIYTDGSMLDVTNANEVPVYPQMDIKMSARYPKVEDPIELYNRFKILRKSLKNTANPIPYDRQSGFAMIEEFIAKESDILAEKGYCIQEIDSEGKRSLTLKGAYLLTWKSAFPGKRIQGLLDTRYSNKLLEMA